MALKYVKLLVFNMLVALNIQLGVQCPSEITDAKALYKSGETFTGKAEKTEYGEIADRTQPITMDKIKQKLKDIGVFDVDDPTLTDMEKKELSKLFDAVEIMTQSRARQPFSVQSMFPALRLVERAVKKQLKENQISESLANKFHWDKLHTVRGPEFEAPLAEVLR